MTVDEFIRLANVLFVFLGVVGAAVFGWLQVRGKNSGDALKATSESIILLSERLSVMEEERAERDRRIDVLQNRLDQLEEDNAELKKRNVELSQRLQSEIIWRKKLEIRVDQLEKENAMLLDEIKRLKAV